MKTSFGKTEKLLNSSDRSSQKKCCGTAPANRETVSTNTAQLHIRIKINRKIGSAMIDSGMTMDGSTKKLFHYLWPSRNTRRNWRLTLSIWPVMTSYWGYHGSEDIIHRLIGSEKHSL